MSASLAINRAAPDVSPSRDAPRLIAIVRAVLALLWAAGLVIAVGDRIPSTDSDVPIAAAALLASYPAIDVIASIAAALGTDTSGRVLRINAAISALAVAAIGAAAFGADAGATLTAFGAWAAVSGAIQLGIAIHRRRTEARQLPMIVSGGLSTIAGISFLAASGNDDAPLAALAGYMAVGALLYLLYAYRSGRPTSGPVAADRRRPYGSEPAHRGSRRRRDAAKPLTHQESKGQSAMSATSPTPDGHDQQVAADVSDTTTVQSARPTIVLVHGAWADSSSWAPVIERLRESGYRLRAIANPLQGLASDTAYLSSYLATIQGPMVLVGHSYGGALITNVDASAFDIKSLVYVAGFIPIKGETVGQLAAQSSPPLPLVSVDVPEGTEVAIEPGGFREAFAGDVDDTAAAQLAIVQRPANVKAVSEAVTNEAFRSVPSWALITRQDRAISHDLQRFMVSRTDAHITEVDASHAVMISHPDVVADVIEQAAAAAVLMA
jgi:pimeloyl-ACP methyl ester carboxylesterase/uncharacterized membrane protein HdeD (DUF308 family)